MVLQSIGSLLTHHSYMNIEIVGDGSRYLFPDLFAEKTFY